MVLKKALNSSGSQASQTNHRETVTKSLREKTNLKEERKEKGETEETEETEVIEEIEETEEIRAMEKGNKRSF